MLDGGDTALAKAQQHSPFRPVAAPINQSIRPEWRLLFSHRASLADAGRLTGLAGRLRRLHRLTVAVAIGHWALSFS